MSKKEKIVVLNNPDQLNDILGYGPKWIIRWGNTINLTLITILLLGSWYFEYPDSIESKIVLKNINTLNLTNIKKSRDIYFGTLQIKEALGNKVKPGQEIILKIDDSSFEDLGIIQGTLREIYKTPINGMFEVIIDFSDESIIKLKKHNIYTNQMRGSAEIIIRRIRMFDKIIKLFLLS